MEGVGTFEHGVAQDCVFGFGPLSAFAGHGRQRDKAGKTKRYFHTGRTFITLQLSADAIVVSPEVGGRVDVGGVLKLISSDSFFLLTTTSILKKKQNYTHEWVIQAPVLPGDSDQCIFGGRMYINSWLPIYIIDLAGCTFTHREV